MFRLDVDDIRFSLFNALNCLIVICFGHPNPDSQYLPGYQEYGPPTITTITHSAGKNLQLSCASGNLLHFAKNQDYYITWEFKPCAGKSIVPCQLAVKNSGIPICGKQIMQPCRKKLTIYKPTASESGIYSCHLNKRDAMEFNLIVSMYQVDFTGKERDPPKFLGDEPKNKSVVMLHQVSFECRASSPSFPASIRWVRRIDKAAPVYQNQTNNASIISYKNFTYSVIQGNKIIDPYYIKEAGPLAHDVYLSKLVIRRAELHHSGHYACVAMNSIGISYREMHLTILPLTAFKGLRRPPQLIGDKPKNVSIVVPQTAVLECHVHSSLPPVVRWVRRVEQIPFNTVNFTSSIEYINNSYQLLNWNDAEEGYYRYYIDEAGPIQNDIYMSKLVFPVTTVLDTGFYACVVMNDMGIIHREVFLNINPVHYSRDENLARISLIIVILVPVTLMTVMLLLCYQKWRNYESVQHRNKDYLRTRVYLEHYNNTIINPIKITKATSNQ